MGLSYKKLFFPVAVLFLTACINFSQTSEDQGKLHLTLKQCIELTLKNNNSRNAYAYAVKSAEAKIKQANSGHYPSLDLTTAYTVQDEDMNFIQPSFGIPINLSALSIPPLTFQVPQQNIKVADNQTFAVQLDFMLPIFLGGKISSYVKQAESNLEMVKYDSRQNDDEIIFQTKKIYYAVILASKLKNIAQEAFDRMSSTLKFTESLYQEGSGRVTKSDYLKNKTMVEVIKAIVSQLEGEEKVAQAALINAMGLEWNSKIEIQEDEIPYIQLNEPLENLVEVLKANNPFLAKVENGLNALQSKIDESKSDYFPSVALMGTYRRLFSDYDYGFTTKENKNLWTVGLGMQINLFNGLRTSARVEEAKANYYQLTEQKELLRKGLTLKLQYIYYKLKSTGDKLNASQEAAATSTENRDLVERAYYSDLMELEDMIQAQLTESMTSAQLQLVKYEYAVLEAELDSVLSKNVQQ